MECCKIIRDGYSELGEWKCWGHQCNVDDGGKFSELHTGSSCVIYSCYDG